MDQLAKNFLGSVARCYHQANGVGALVVDLENTRYKWATLEDLTEGVRGEIVKDIKESGKESSYVLLEDTEGKIHVGKAQVSDVPDPKALTKNVMLLTATDESIREVTRACVEALRYPKHLLTWEVVPVGKENDAIERTDSEVIVHVSNGDVYFPDSVGHLVMQIVGGSGCTGCTSSLVYDLAKGTTHLAFEDDMGMQAMKRDTLAYTKAFWERNKWGSQENLMELVQHFLGNATDVSSVPPVDVMCFVTEDAPPLPVVANLFDASVLDEA